MVKEEPVAKTNKDGPSAYIADIGKGVLLANAKLKLLEEFIENTSLDAKQSILKELEAALQSLQDLAYNHTTGKREILNHLANSFKDVDTAIAKLLKNAMDELSRIENKNDTTLSEISKAIHSITPNIRIDLDKALSGVYNSLFALGKQQENEIIKLFTELSELKVTIKEIINHKSQLLTEIIDDRSRLLLAGQSMIRKWLLWITVAVILLSGSSVAMLAYILMQK